MIELLWNAPVSESKLASQIAALAVVDGNSILDVGCGCGEVLLRIGEQYAVQATGIDSSGEHIAEASRRAAGRSMAGDVQFIEANAAEWPVEAESLDIALCLGASHAFGLGTNAYGNALQRLIPMLGRGGRLLISEAYAKRPVPEPYKEFIGDSLTDGMTHAANVETATSLGLIPLGAWTSSDDEWDEFEWTYQRIVEQRANQIGADEAASKRLIDRRKWMEGYLRWGRDTLGYGTYLFIKPD